MNEMNSYFRADLHVAIAAPIENEENFRGRSIIFQGTPYA
ncbi:hypothetical protein SBF1_730016 [Candidatus Desulfosporosinus infrequens]|uniref:Uncharacterized protein n=1 Tax=Candidatus Desulfosporosinus infrequens TaxID=2043169 RepID=A0A2U3LQE1_9FIRM|nr:hypothetical protein SBF1_730016 [Candidatus Desulfosporosinus infrequens]